MAEGAIEGSAEMYEVPSGDAVNFVFSRFHVQRLEAAGGLLLPAGEAAGVESGETGGTRFAAGPDVEASLGRPSRRLAEVVDCNSDGVPDHPICPNHFGITNKFFGSMSSPFTGQLEADTVCKLRWCDEGAVARKFTTGSLPSCSSCCPNNDCSGWNANGFPGFLSHDPGVGGSPCEGRSIECKDPEMWESCYTALQAAELGKCVHYGRPEITMGLINNSLINNNLHVMWTSSIKEAGNNWGMKFTTVGDPSPGSTECSATCKERAACLCGPPGTNSSTWDPCIVFHGNL